MTTWPFKNACGTLAYLDINSTILHWRVELAGVLICKSKDMKGNNSKRFQIQSTKRIETNKKRTRKSEKAKREELRVRTMYIIGQATEFFFFSAYYPHIPLFPRVSQGQVFYLHNISFMNDSS